MMTKTSILYYEGFLDIEEWAEGEIHPIITTTHGLKVDLFEELRETSEEEAYCYFYLNGKLIAMGTMVCNEGVEGDGCFDVMEPDLTGCGVPDVLETCKGTWVNIAVRIIPVRMR